MITCQHPLYDRESLVILGIMCNGRCRYRQYIRHWLWVPMTFIGQKYGLRIAMWMSTAA